MPIQQQYGNIEANDSSVSWKDQMIHQMKDKSDSSGQAGVFGVISQQRILRQNNKGTGEIFSFGAGAHGMQEMPHLGTSNMTSTNSQVEKKATMATIQTYGSGQNVG